MRALPWAITLRPVGAKGKKLGDSPHAIAWQDTRGQSPRDGGWQDTRGQSPRDGG